MSEDFLTVTGRFMPGADGATLGFIAKYAIHIPGMLSCLDRMRFPHYLKIPLNNSNFRYRETAAFQNHPAVNAATPVRFGSRHPVPIPSPG